MKKLLTLCFMALALCAMAQNKKIALLEPRSGEGSSVGGFEKGMLRGELRKAIVNHTGYEAFTRSDIDQLMNEQNFQRTGNVSDEDIHKLGEMSGADYICISTIHKSNTEFYIEAYLINIESGAISNPASQYGELVEGKLSNMLPVCQALAQELLGTANPVISVPTAAKPTNAVQQPQSATTNVSSNKADNKVNLCVFGSIRANGQLVDAVIEYKITSTTPDVQSTDYQYAGTSKAGGNASKGLLVVQCNYSNGDMQGMESIGEGLTPLYIEGLTSANCSNVSIILRISKEGYRIDESTYPLKSQSINIEKQNRVAISFACQLKK